MIDIALGFSIPAEALIGAVGILITIFVGYFFYKIGSRASRISLVCSSPIELFHSIVRELEGVEISYNEGNISESLMLVGFLLLNTGSNDIKLTDSDKPVTFRTPKHYKWREFNIINQSDEVDCRKLSVSDEEVQVKWDVLRKGERIRFNALVEQVPIDDKTGIGNGDKEQGKEDPQEFVRHLELLHRIPNTKLRKEKLSWTEVDSSWPKTEYTINIIISVSLLMPVIVFILFVLFQSVPTITKMGYTIDQGASVDTVYVMSVGDDSLEVESPLSDSTYFIKRDTFDKNGITLLEIKNPVSRSFKWGVVVMVLFGLLAVINAYMATMKYKHAKHLVRMFQKQPLRDGSR